MRQVVPLHKSTIGSQRGEVGHLRSAATAQCSVSGEPKLGQWQHKSVIRLQLLMFAQKEAMQLLQI